MENETIRLLMHRKSVRAFEPEEMDEADVQRILAAAVQAPSAGNMTLWTAIRVTDAEKKAALAESCDHQPFIAQAPLVLVFCADYNRWLHLFETLELGEPLRRPAEGDFMLATVDAVIAAHTAVTAAEALGYGSCYIGDILENCDTQREILGLPAYVKPVCMAVFGRATQQQKERKKPGRFSVETVVHENSYREIAPEQMRELLIDRDGMDAGDAQRRLTAFCKRKWNCAFSEEMSRSAQQMIDDWNAGR